ncbi:MAG: VIT1/CCC1 transporter family protein [Niastella sp.]|nr:VIT1/CCC1 transporter family protein [Niastella sp.]
MKTIFFGDFFTGFGDGIIVPLSLIALLTSSSYTNLQVFNVGLIVCIIGALLLGISSWLTQVHENSESKNKRQEDHLQEIMEAFGFTEQMKQDAMTLQKKDDVEWELFVSQLNLKENTPNKAAYAGLITALSFFVGGMIPLLPFYILLNPSYAFIFSIVSSLLMLLIYGVYKSFITGKSKNIDKIHPLLIGILVSLATYLVGKYILQL